MCDMTTCTMEFKLLVANTPHDGGIAIPTREREFPLLVRWSAMANKLEGTISYELPHLSQNHALLPMVCTLLKLEHESWNRASSLWRRLGLPTSDPCA